LKFGDMGGFLPTERAIKVACIPVKPISHSIKNLAHSCYVKRGKRKKKKGSIHGDWKRCSTSKKKKKKKTGGGASGGDG